MHRPKFPAPISLCVLLSTTDKTASWIWIIKSGPATILYGPQYPKMLSEMIAFALEIITCKTELIVSSLPASFEEKHCGQVQSTGLAACLDWPSEDDDFPRLLPSKTLGCSVHFCLRISGLRVIVDDQVKGPIIPLNEA